MSPQHRWTGGRERNYDQEARQLIKDLTDNQLYELYEIVHKQKNRSQSETRDKELVAVTKAIESVNNLDKSRLHKIKKGFGSSMAAEAKASDGNTQVNKRRV